jgi:type II secretory pathway predicted ATPase ExeA
MNYAEPLPVIEMLDTSSIPGRETIEEHSSVPLKFFKIDRHPFADNVNPQFFYRTEAHEAAFMAMRRCIEDDVSLGLTTAVSGTGKTLLTQVLLQDLSPKRYKPALVLIYPKMSRTALLREICAELGIEVTAKKPTTHDLVGAIQQKTMDLYLQNIKLVLIIDEVHFLNVENLQVLRTLSNIEIPEKKLVTILLFGEDSFLKKLEDPEFKSILSRMFTRVRLRPLERGEVEQYVKYRLLLVSCRTNLFDPECYNWLAEESKGIPREINRLCHGAMQRAAERGCRCITKEILAQVH